MAVPSIGVEEEYQLVDPESSELRSDCKQVQHNLIGRTDSSIQDELHLSQIEMASTVCQTLEEVRKQLVQTRGLLANAAARTGLALAAAGTHPMPSLPLDDITPKERYRRMTERYQQVARDLLIFGCHVHVSIPDRDVGVEVMNRTRAWLPILQAISANSPYWDGQDTGYASYRRELWGQWPIAGPPPQFNDLADYEASAEELQSIGAIEDESELYWDIRLPTHVPTIEYRVADVMTNIEETVGFTGVVRALVMKTVAEIQAGVEYRPTRLHVLRYALWQAARYGVSGRLVDAQRGDCVPAHEVIERLEAYIAEPLEQTGDRPIVQRYLGKLREAGTGAARQRRAAGPQRDLSSVVKACIVN